MEKEFKNFESIGELLSFRGGERCRKMSLLFGAGFILGLFVVFESGGLEVEKMSKFLVGVGGWEVKI